MKSIIVGFIGIVAMVVLSIEGGIDQYMQKHAIYLVVGGTLFVFFISTPDQSLKVIKESFINLFKTEERFIDYKGELEMMTRVRSLAEKSKNDLINYAVELWDQGVDENLFIVLISQKKMELESDSVEALQSLKNLSKYPPGLGITGTVMGMITLFSTLDDNKANVGASIALAMSATFFGLFLTNVFIGPVADRIQIRYMNRKRLLQNIYKVLLLINQNEPAALINGEIEDEAAA